MSNQFTLVRLNKDLKYIASNRLDNINGSLLIFKVKIIRIDECFYEEYNDYDIIATGKFRYLQKKYGKKPDSEKIPLIFFAKL
jgi:hypothetical protein